jgi:Cytochrome b5-like Heme/Steroid binding domain
MIQWLVIDSKVYDVTKFSALHPGGTYVLLNEGVAGKDATTAFYSLHRQEVLQKPQYARLQIGVIAGEEATIQYAPKAISQVPYAEPTWLASGFHNPYYSDSHRKFHAAMRKFFVEVISPDAQACEENGKRASLSVLTKMAYVSLASVISPVLCLHLC